MSLIPMMSRVSWRAVVGVLGRRPLASRLADGDRVDLGQRVLVRVRQAGAPCAQPTVRCLPWSSSSGKKGDAYQLAHET